MVFTFVVSLFLFICFFFFIYLTLTILNLQRFKSSRKSKRTVKNFNKTSNQKKGVIRVMKDFRIVTWRLDRGK